MCVCGAIAWVVATGPGRRLVIGPAVGLEDTAGLLSLDEVMRWAAVGKGCRLGRGAGARGGTFTSTARLRPRERLDVQRPQLGRNVFCCEP